MESSIVELRPGRIADLRQRIAAADKKLAKLRDPKPQQRMTRKQTSRPSARERAPRTFEKQRAQATRRCITGVPDSQR